ncbi:MAG TPA: indole-3-glycerol phosphate synthase TrpC [Myxococcota bacterium]|nr:indole-3-glycerol phosphate synthase TrpC [Myxococcota bacterium]
MILDEILAHKRIELARAREHESADRLARRAERAALRPRGFAAALRAAPSPPIIAELKRRSPSRGEIRADFDPVTCARAYADGGAAALSVLTDERYFGGQLEYLEKVRAAVPLPLLRKDFVIDASQVDEARVAGADAVLLIAAALDPTELRALSARARALDLDALVEVHDEAELEVALEAGAGLVGINNRDLRTFETDLAVTERLAPRIPRDVLVVAESGIFDPRDVARLARAGAHAFLVGESLMRQPDLASALRTLRRGP